MDSDYLQNLRYKLQKRVRRLNSADHTIFPVLLKQWWGFLQQNSFFQGLKDKLASDAERVNHEVQSMLQSPYVQHLPGFDDELSHVLMSYIVLKACAQQPDQTQNIVLKFRGLAHGSNKVNDTLDAFREIFLEPFYDYLDEGLDDAAAVLGYLKRYKHRCEWFRREELYNLWTSDSKRGEKHLALDLYEYLFEQGIDFSIEPTSASGEADLVSSQQGENRLIADAKIFNPEKGKDKSYLISGFNQIYSYTRDFNESVGYLIIFKTCGADLRVAVSESTSHIPFITHNNKVIFLLVIDIFPYEESASKRGALKTIEITEADFVQLMAGLGEE